MAAPAPIPDQLIYLIIRFAASIPDLSLPISSPRTTTTLSLKQLIRPNLPPTHSSALLRLIYAGKVLADAAPLSLSLRLPPPPPPRNGTYNEHGPGSKSKGKQPIRHDTPTADDDASTAREATKYYIHCSLGDALSPNALTSEATLAQNSELSLQKQSSVTVHQPTTSHRRTSSGAISGGSGYGTTDAGPRRGSSTTTSGAPQGFDRLLASGFTAQEIATLRSQFQNNLSFTHTPDTMPSPAEIRALEDRWLDTTATDPSPTLTADADAGWGAGFGVEEGGLDDMLFGSLTGFFWPLGALVWGLREEGIWTRRRQIAVVGGVLLNAAFGFLRWGS